jgi:hypothetical protein
MTPEAYCAELLRLREREEFLAVGEQVALTLNPRYHEDRRAGRAESLPDLLSRGRDARLSLREVKYKLEEKTIRKAASQLATGAALLPPAQEIDRLEIVVPLRDRKLKDHEQRFLGEAIDGRYALQLDGRPVTVRVRGRVYPITVVVL